MESKGTEPLRCWLVSSIFLTKLISLQVIPLKLHTDLFDSQESNMSVLEFLKAILMVRSSWSSSEFAMEKRERIERREKK